MHYCKCFRLGLYSVPCMPCHSHPPYYLPVMLGHVSPRWPGSSQVLLACLNPLSTLLRRGIKEMQRRRAQCAHLLLQHSIPLARLTVSVALAHLILIWFLSCYPAGRAWATVCHRPSHCTECTTWLIAQHVYMFGIHFWICIAISCSGCALCPMYVEHTWHGV